MKHWSFYRLDTGLFTGGSLSASHEDLVESNTPEGCGAYEGIADPECQKVDLSTGELIDYQPPAPSADHRWDTAAKRWQLSPDAQRRAEAYAAIYAGIAKLEAGQQRALRETALQMPGAGERLKAIDDAIAQLRKSL